MGAVFWGEGELVGAMVWSILAQCLSPWGTTGMRAHPSASFEFILGLLKSCGFGQGLSIPWPPSACFQGTQAQQDEAPE